MARNRTIYNVLALYASQVAPTGQQTGVGAIQQLSRVQSFDEDFSRSFTDVNQYGNLASIDRLEVEAPTVNASFSYYLTDGLNERLLGLTTATTGSASNASIISGLLTKATDEKNYYLMIADEGNDAAGYLKSRTGVIAVGNGFITSYSVSAAVGDIPTASVDLEGLNIRIYNDINNVSGTVGPGINASNGQLLTGVKFSLPAATSMTGANIPNALLPGDIVFTPTGLLGFDATDLKVQDFTLTMDLARTPLQRIGSRFAFAREIDFPLTATLEMNAQVGDIGSTGDLSSLLCDTNLNNFTITMRKPACGGTGANALTYEFKGAKLTSQNFSSSIGDNATMSATFEVQVGSAQQTDRGIFLSGSYNPPPTPQGA